MNEATPSKLMPALIGGASWGVASALPVVGAVNCACCALVIGGGVLAAFLWLKEVPPTYQASYGDGASLGVVTGVFGAVVVTILTALVQLVGLGGAAQLEQAMSQLRETQDIPPEVEELVNALTSGTVSVGLILILIILWLVLGILFSIVGGIVGIAIFRKKETPAQA